VDVRLINGLIAVGWLEVQSWRDPKHLFPVSFFAFPYVLSIAAGWVVHTLSNALRAQTWFLV
jgi:hypothetical protein